LHPCFFQRQAHEFAAALDARPIKKFIHHATLLILFGLTQLSSRILMFGAAIVLVLRLALA
jgi:hypothetical protein